MATVSKTIDVACEFSEEELAMLEALKHRPIIIDDDCPAMTVEKMRRGIELAKKRQLAREQAKLQY